MKKLNRLKDFSLDKNNSSEEIQKDNKIDKVLCIHCGRTAGNGIRCIGICVADDEY